MSAVAATLLACGGAALTAVAGSRAPDWLNRIAVALRASSGGW